MYFLPFAQHTMRSTDMRGKKIAVSGKGGVGKSTVVALWALKFAREGNAVMAIDADPDANLAHALGMPKELRGKLSPLAHDAALIQERTGASAGKTGQLFSLNPRVADLASRYGVNYKGVNVVELGAVRKGGGGCACPESTLLKSLIRHLVLSDDETIILDMEAGVEHIGRATAQGVDALVVVTEAGTRSLETAMHIRKLAADIGLDKKMAVLLNKVRAGSDQRKLAEALLPGIPVIGSVPFDDRLIRCDEAGGSLFDVPSADDLLDLFNEAATALSGLIASGFSNFHPPNGG
jgi:CO dehydrogenase maturation factor